MSEFDLQRLLRDVFTPRVGEQAVVLTDLPHDDLDDHPDWAERRNMARAWRHALAELGLEVLPLLQYPATGAHNADLPEAGDMGGEQVSIGETVCSCHIAIAMTEFSATAPLFKWVRQCDGTLRAASMPGVLRSMEATALAADYKVVARRTHMLAERLTRAESATVIFTTGHTVIFDLRFRKAHADDGRCTRDKPPDVINLPSGEAYIVPYEGERPDDPSRTAGSIPVSGDGGMAVLLVENNKVLGVEGDEPVAGTWREMLGKDLARRNVAELGLGCNDRAVISGVVLEDEKVGFHWAFGRSEHLGGVVGPEAFTGPEHVLHQDVVYAPGCPISIERLILHYPAGGEEEIMRDGDYTIF